MWRDSVLGTFTVAAVLCIVCSVVVSFAAVKLRPLQEANELAFQKRNILIAAGMDPDEVKDPAVVVSAFENIETWIIDLETGKRVQDGNGVDYKTYDQKAASKEPSQSIAIDADRDVAGIKRREKLSRVYLLSENGKVQKVILPVYGKGLWSTLYGYLALESDLQTVAGLTFYQHAETPGLGGEVDNPSWKAKWPGKQLYDAQGNLQIEVIKGSVTADSANAQHQVDGLTGATITTRGVSNLIRYWISDDGFGPFLKRLEARSGGASDG